MYFDASRRHGQVLPKMTELGVDIEILALVGFVGANLSDPWGNECI